MKLIVLFFIILSIAISCKSQNLDERDKILFENEVLVTQNQKQEEKLDDTIFVNL
jgi:hypothetical protein